MDETREERRKSRLSDAEIRAIALLVREEIMDDIYREIGSVVIKRALAALVLFGVACSAYFFGRENIK